MNFIKCCLIPSVAFLLFGIGLAFFLTKDMPTEWQVEVEVTVQAPLSAVQELVGNLRRWEEWNGFNELYPEPELGFENESLDGDPVLTAQSRDFDLRFRVTRNDPASGIWFERLPAEGDATAESIQFETVADGTRVVWRSNGSRGDDVIGRCFNAAIQSSLDGGLQQNLYGLQGRLARGQ